MTEAGLGGLARATELRRNGNLRGAAEELERELTAGDASLEVRQASAEIHLLMGDLEAAADAYGALVAEREDSPKLWNERGVAVHRLARFDEAVHAYRRTVALDHAYSLGWNNLGVALAQRGEEGAAERALRQATAGTAPPEILWNLGLFLTRLERPDEAVETYREALEIDRSSAESWARLGSALFQAREPAGARDALLQALERDPDLADARYQLGFALSALGDFRGALRETQRALEQAPVIPTPQYQLLIDAQFEDGTLPAPETTEGERVPSGSPVAGFDFEPKSLDNAFAGFRPRDPSPGTAEIQTFVDEGRTALRRGQLRKAAAAASRAVRAAPEALDPRLIEGEVLLRQGLAGEALERFEGVLRGEADTRQVREALTGRARALLDLGRAKDAIAAARAVEDAGGGGSFTARALLAAERWTDAVSAFERAVQNGEVDATTLAGYGSALLGAGRPADARKVFTRSLATSPSVAARVGLGQALEALGDRPGAMRAYREGVTALPSYGPAVLRLAMAEWRSGKAQDAVRSLVQFLDLDPTHVAALVQLGTWLGELGRVEQALRSLHRALSLDAGNAEARRELERLSAAGRGG